MILTGCWLGSGSSTSRWGWRSSPKLLDRHPVSLLRWSPVSDSRRTEVTPGGHASTLAAYRLLDALAERYPGLAVVSSSTDLAMARRAGAIDSATDAARRHREFVRWLQLRPPELVWQPAYDESEEVTSAGFRAVSAFFGQLGLGLDLRRQSPPSLRSIHRWLALYKRFRPLLHTGATVRSDDSSRGFLSHGVVAGDRDEALYALVWLDPFGRSPGPVRGARPDRSLSAGGGRAAAGRCPGGHSCLVGGRRGPGTQRASPGDRRCLGARGASGVGPAAVSLDGGSGIAELIEPRGRRRGVLRGSRGFAA